MDALLDVATNQNKQHPLDKRDGGKNHDEQDEFSYRKLDKARNAESHDDTYFLRNAERIALLAVGGGRFALQGG